MQRVSAVPVLNAKGQLVGNVSARNARALVKDPSLMRLIKAPLDEWLSGDYMEVISCTPGDTLESVIKRLIESGVHRIYMVDEHMKPLRVISLRDILARFVKEPAVDYCRKFFGSYSLEHFEGIKHTK